MHRNYIECAANAPSDTQFISSLERDDILRQSHAADIDDDDDDDDDIGGKKENGNDEGGKEDDGSEDELASPRPSGSAPEALDAPDAVITSPTRISPVTPATVLAGRKRDIQGNIVSYDSPAPNLQAFFPLDQSKSTLGLSQLFQQTQAATSPFTNAPRSDPILERPSPDFRAPFQSSPPAVTYSSPLNVEKNDEQPYTPAPASALKSGYAATETRAGAAAKVSELEDDGGVYSSDSDDFNLGFGKVRKGRAGAPRRQFRSKRAKELITPARNSARQGRGRLEGKNNFLAPALATIADSDEVPPLTEERPAPLVDTGEQNELLSLEDEDQEVQVPMSTSRSQPEDILEDNSLEKQVHSSDETASLQKYQTEKIIQSSPRDSVRPQSRIASDTLGVIEDSQRSKAEHQRGLRAASSRLRKSTRMSQAKSSSSLSSNLSSVAISSLQPENDPAVGCSKSAASQDEARRTDARVSERSFNNSIDSLAPLVRAQKRRMRYSVVDTSSPVASSKPEVIQESGSLPQSTSTGLFETAPTSHLADLSSNVDRHQPLDRNQSISLDSPSQSQTSPRRPTVRKLIDIAGDPTPPEARQSIDVSVDILDEEDKQFQAATSEHLGASTIPTGHAVSSLGERALSLSSKEIGGKADENSEHIHQPNSHTDASHPSLPQANIKSAGKLRRPSTKLKPMGKKLSSIQAGKQSSLMVDSHGKTGPTNHQAGAASASVGSQFYKVSTNNTTQSSHFQPRQVETSLGAGTTYSEGNTASAFPAPEASLPKDTGNGTANELREKVHPRRVFARFMDRKLAYYPATCLGKVPARPNVYRVRFDDGTDAELDVFHIRSCELRVGDQVKVDLPAMTKYTYVIKGLPETPSAESKSGQTDVFGNETVTVELRQRNSLPSTGDGAAAATTHGDGEVQVPITSIYFPNLLWSRLKEREYHHVEPATAASAAGAPHTPLEGLSREGSPGTGSRARRQTTIGAAPSVQMPDAAPGTSGSGLFSNMVFAITYTNEKDTGRERARISKQILEHGGRILATGFEELFHNLDAAHFSSSSPSSSSSSFSAAAATASPPSKLSQDNAQETHRDDSFALALTADAQEIGFAALIANTHCRRTKYMQALALNIPCLSGRWIVDCVGRRAVLPWTRYLLAAGESALLGGAVRSRTLSPALVATPAPRAALRAMVAGRTALLRAQHVVIFSDKSMTEEQIKTYLFITHALGAARVERVADLHALKALFAEPSAAWDVVYAKEKKLEEVTAAVSFSASPSSLLPRAVRVVSDECIAQSLILGSLVDQPS